MQVDQLLDLNPYELNQAAKETVFVDLLSELTEDQRHRCVAYDRFLTAMGYKQGYRFKKLSEVPFLPVSIFKMRELACIDSKNAYKVITSSGTTSQLQSHIYLDKDTARRQQKALRNIVENEIGKERVPYLILDCQQTVRNRESFSARTAGIIGFSIFSSKMCFAFDNDMSLNVERVKNFLDKCQNETILIFGFTYILWKHFIRALEINNLHLDLSNGVLIHGGGWKKMEDEKVSASEFKNRIQERTKIHKIFNYYGMAEQTGSICMECEQGHLHTSSYSDLLIRKPEDFKICHPGEEGLIQVISPLQTSYPGHSLLTEDMGVLLGEDDCPCGRKGKYFAVIGRAPRAEVRGCSDTYGG